MAVTAKVFGQFLMCCMRKEVDVLNDDIKIMLLTSASTLSTTHQDTLVYLSDLFAINPNWECVGDGYTQGGKVLTDKSLTYSTSNYIYFKPEQTSGYVQWDNSTISARYAIVYDDTPVTNKPLLGYLDFGQVFTSEEGYFRITFNASGFVRITVS